MIKDASAKRPAGPGRHHLDREIRTSGRAPAQGRRQGLRRSSTPATTSRKPHRRPGRRARRRHHRHQHGRPRHRHPARRQCRHAHRATSSPTCRRARSATRKEAAIRAEVAAAEGEGARRRRPLRARHRAPRKPPHRQPAARPLRPPGRPRPLEILPVAAGRPDAHLRLRAHGRHAAEARPQGRRGDHPSLDQQGAGEGAEEGRGAQLRHPQEPAQIRRRDERPAQGHLRAAHRADGRRDV